ncbi:rRNA pseudouridine synthase [Ureaplasma miroungigenitalium]|uniref:pseudouridine synthase n=1 Tax=Ureaplasma miroungigenitalium TaxID=1042321 RepID=UPI0021E91116|nr:pseudouridine synthase [Ureaplasma miroungigenitalium]MCV3734540.1 rRNA pseudouridine synthase [Ureaplasma miroungigenitalium]
MRIDKLVANALNCSRKDAHLFIRQKRILVNQQPVKISQLIKLTEDVVTFDQEIINYKEFYYYMFNKPHGYLTANYDKNSPVIFDLITELDRNKYFAVGRLDKDTEGLLIITNDGEFAHKMSHPRQHIPKKYYLEVDNDFNAAIIQHKGPIPIENYIVQDYSFNFLTPRSAELTIYEGKFHQVKQMLTFFGYKVVFLKRISFGKINLPDDLLKGQIREFDPQKI